MDQRSMEIAKIERELAIIRRKLPHAERMARAARQAYFLAWIVMGGLVVYAAVLGEFWGIPVAFFSVLVLVGLALCHQEPVADYLTALYLRYGPPPRYWGYPIGDPRLLEGWINEREQRLVELKRKRR